MSSGRSLVVVGAGGHAKVVISTAQAAGWTVVSVVDDDPATWGHEVSGAPVTGGLDRVGPAAADAVVLGVGSNRSRMVLAARVGGPWATLVHPSAWLDPSVRLGEGTVVFAGAVIQPDSLLGRHVIVNTGATVDHDCRVGDYVHLAPGSNLAGGVSVDEGAFVGIGACAVPGVTIGAWSVVGAGAAALAAVPAGATVVGVPARVIRRSE